MTFFLEGGFPMVFVAVFGGVAFASALRFALHPAHGRVAPIVAYGVAVALVSVAGLCVDLATVFRYCGQSDEDRVPILLVGAAESMAPPIFGFSVLAIVALVTAIGLRRLPPA